MWKSGYTPMQEMIGGSNENPAGYAAEAINGLAAILAFHEPRRRVFIGCQMREPMIDRGLGELRSGNR